MTKGVEQEPSSLDVSMNDTFWRAWYLSRPDLANPNNTIITVEHTNRKLVAVVVYGKGIPSMIYNQHLKGIVDNPEAKTFTIISDNINGDPAHATFRTRFYDALLVYLKTNPSNP